MTDVSQISREEGSKFEKQLYNTLKENSHDIIIIFKKIIY
jgi:hypothetical protein